MLETLLEWYRAGVLTKVAGVSQAHAVATPLRTSTSIAGLVKHLALVEDSWLSVRFAGGADPEVWAGIDWDDDPDWEFHSVSDQPIEEVVDLYRGACDRSRAVTADRSLDDIGADTSRREFSLRFVYLHLIEETARHLGHLDILRELLDGTTGE